MLDDIWDSMLDAPEQVLEFFSGMFENIGEFSVTGLILGITAVAFVIVLGKWTLDPFLKFYSPIMKIVMTGLVYLVNFVGGYLLGNYFENS